jgi:hypothetical protein
MLPGAHGARMRLILSLRRPMHSAHCCVKTPYTARKTCANVCQSRGLLRLVALLPKIADLDL